MQRTKSSLDDFIRFMNVEVKNLESIKLPEQKELQKVKTTNVLPTFGSAGSLLSSLVSGALDLGGLVSNFFGGKKKNPSPKTKPIPKGKKLRIPGIRGLGIVSAALAGLDFAQGMSEGESVGKAGAGALGSAAGAAGGTIAGTMLAGAIGQALVPVPGLGFVLGAAAGSLGGLAGGWLADRAYESVTGEGKVKAKQKEELARSQAKQKLGAETNKTSLSGTLDKFDSVVYKFENAVFTGSLSSAGSMSVSAKPKSGAEIFHEEIQERKGGGKPPENIVESSYMVSGGSLPSKHVNTYDFNEDRGSYRHHGEDLPINQGTPVSIVVPGTVRQAQFSNNAAGGNILITHEDGKETRYLHMSQINVAPGQKVESGQVIGLTGGEPGTKGAGRSSGPHLHFEYYDSTTAGPSDPNPHMDKYFRFGGNIQVKAKATSAQSGQPGGTAPTVVLAAGTNNFGDGNTNAAAASLKRTITSLQGKGYNVVFVPPSDQGDFANISAALTKVARETGATVEKAQYNRNDATRAYAHMTPDEYDRLRNKYQGATFMGDSNAAALAGKQIPGQAVDSQRMETIEGFAQNLKPSSQSSAKPQTRDRRSQAAAARREQQSQVQAVSQQPVPPQQLEQYPTYNTPTNTVTVVPIVASGGGNSNQRPIVISSSGGGGETTIMPPVPERQIVNSLMATTLLTTLSAT